LPRGSSLTLDFKAATTTIPIVGLLVNRSSSASYQVWQRPGGNNTGISADVGDEQWGKRLQLLKQMVPQATRLWGLGSREARMQSLAKGVQLVQLLQRIGLTGVGPPLNRPIDEAEYRRVFAALAQEGAEEIIVSDEPEHYTNLRLIIELAKKGRLPAIYPYRECVEAGGLMSYGVDLREIGDRAADMVDRILKGATPGEMPVFQPTRLFLTINLKTAKALDLPVPPVRLATADEVIE
jgi:putative tryptophan/tyrosine transport system substrate-binding protein